MQENWLEMDERIKQWLSALLGRAVQISDDEQVLLENTLWTAKELETFGYSTNTRLQVAYNHEAHPISMDSSRHVE